MTTQHPSSKEQAADEVWRDYRRGANAVEAALLDLQAEHGLSNLEMIKVLQDYQRTLLGYELKDQHARRARRRATAVTKPGTSPSVRS